MEELKYSVVGRLSMQRGDDLPTMMEIQNRLKNTWKVEKVRAISLGKGTFHILVKSPQEKCTNLTTGAVFPPAWCVVSKQIGAWFFHCKL